MTSPVLVEFFAREVNDFVRHELLRAIADLTTGQRYFTFNVFNVLVDGDTATVTVEDELDVTRRSTLALEEFSELLRGGIDT